MGIDITAYRKIEKFDCTLDEDGKPVGEVGNWVRFYLNPNFPGRADDIENEATYRYEEAEHGLSCGYGGYNHLREELARLAGYPLGQYEQYGSHLSSHCVEYWNGQEGAFSELINFSNCEGTIGATVAKKLANDFAEYQQKADSHEDDRFRNFYADMRRVFDVASDQGAVRFW